MTPALKTAALTVAVLFVIGVTLAGTADLFFGSSKIRPLFGMSADALSGDPKEDDSRDGGVRDGGY